MLGLYVYARGDGGAWRKAVQPGLAYLAVNLVKVRMALCKTVGAALEELGRVAWGRVGQC